MRSPDRPITRPPSAQGSLSVRLGFRTPHQARLSCISIGSICARVGRCNRPEPAPRDTIGWGPAKLVGRHHRVCFARFVQKPSFFCLSPFSYFASPSVFLSFSPARCGVIPSFACLVNSFCFFTRLSLLLLLSLFILLFYYSASWSSRPF